MSNWIKSSHRCDHGNCVEVWPGYRMWVRDSTQPQEVLSFDRADWQAFAVDLRAGKLDR